MKQLTFGPQKSRGQFLENYKRHDSAIEIVKAYLHEHSFKILDYGPDRRGERIWGSDIPDLLAWRNGYWLVLIDVKGHSGDVWMLNERAYNAYLGYSEHYQIPVVCIWVNLANKHIYYAEVPFFETTIERMPHDGNNVIKTQDAKPIDGLIKRLRINGPNE